MGRLVVVKKQPWKRPAGWIVPGHGGYTQLHYDICARAMADNLLCETPLGSNRNPRIDEYTRWAGLEPPVYWCAIWVARMWADAGAKIPQGFPSCDAWLEHMVPWSKRRYGDAILYGKPGDARHIGIYLREEKIANTRPVKTVPFSIEGNRGIHGSQTNNGIGVFAAPVDRPDILGVVHPVAA